MYKARVLKTLQPARTLPIDLLTSPFIRFAKLGAASGILLLVSTLAAIVWANSPWEHSYHELWNTQVSIGFGRFVLSESRHAWVDDGLMSIFFFLVGLEIKREVLIGELSSLKQATLPLVAALGGVIVPALAYLLIAHVGPNRRGWGIPMATDIAFVLGALTLLGDRVPTSLKIFVTALAIIDDIAAVLVISIFYTDQIRFSSLAVGMAGLLLALVANVMGVRRPIIYAAIGVAVWLAVVKSGVHATIAGVLLAFTVPARTYVDREVFLERSRQLLDRFDAACTNSFEAHAAIHTLEGQLELIESPLHRIEHYLQPWVSFVVMPLFAFTNGGVRILGNISAALKQPVCVGVVLGLFVGKPLGISLFAWVSARIGLTTKPSELSWGQIFGAGWLCGIGFTMSLFIASLAIQGEALLDMAKLGILSASIGSGICGSIFLRRAANRSG